MMNYVRFSSTLVGYALSLTILTGVGTAHAWTDEQLAAADSHVDRPGLEHVEPPSDLENAGRAAWRTAKELIDSGKREEAVLHLNVTEVAYPRIADRVQLMRANVLMDLDRPKRACADYRKALSASLDNAVQVLARVGTVRCLIAADDTKASKALIALKRRYPEMPERNQLDYELARMYERRERRSAAANIYRRLDMEHPGSHVARLSRERMAAMTKNGLRFRRLTLEQRVDRAVRLTKQGPMHMARDAISELLGNKLPDHLKGELLIGSARMARVEGRFEDAHDLYMRGKKLGARVDSEREQYRFEAAAEAAYAGDQQRAATRIRRIKGKRSWARMLPVRLLDVVQTASHANLGEEATEALNALSQHRRARHSMVFEAATAAVGVVDDNILADVFGNLAERPWKNSIASRYHRARALERLGRWVEAERELLRVQNDDRSATRYYAMWANQRLWTVREAILCKCSPAQMREKLQATHPKPSKSPLLASVALVDTAPAIAPHYEGKIDWSKHESSSTQPAPNLMAIAAALYPIAERHQDAYPWFMRAHDMLELGERDAAVAELLEAYLAWREGTGRPLRRVGLEAVYRGKERARKFVPFRTKKQRRQLTRDEREVLAGLLEQLGDDGTAAGFGGWDRVKARPRAYSREIETVAKKYGLDPNLLHAVMRVESVYQKHILSFAGAIGLMQIMPRTGRLIAERLGRDAYTTDDLLNPRTNLEFAAWYLSSLIDRFDGRLPLAIASYNGGPHNVRRWINNYGESIPLDAFLERIPFTETHRYVRRVLTHYAAYREQQGLPMEKLSLQLPTHSVDRMAF